MYKVYKHTFPNGKIYIGIALDVYSRWCNGNGYKENSLMYSDILKYGWDNIKHEILINDLETKKEAELKEKELILAYDSENPEKGYNRTNYKRDLLKIEGNETKKKEKKKNKSNERDLESAEELIETLERIKKWGEEEWSYIKYIRDLNLNDYESIEDTFLGGQYYKIKPLPKSLLGELLTLLTPFHSVKRNGFTRPAFTRNGFTMSWLEYNGTIYTSAKAIINNKILIIEILYTLEKVIPIIKEFEEAIETPIRKG